MKKRPRYCTLLKQKLTYLVIFIHKINLSKPSSIVRYTLILCSTQKEVMFPSKLKHYIACMSPDFRDDNMYILDTMK